MIKFKRRKKTRKSSLFFENTKRKIFKKRNKQTFWKFLKIIKKWNPRSISLSYYYAFWIVLIIISLLTLLFWPFFKVKEINIYRDDDIANINIAYIALKDIRWKNMFFIDKKHIKTLIKSYQENIKKIEINLKLPNSIDITISSYEPTFNISLNNKNYF